MMLVSEMDIRNKVRQRRKYCMNGKGDFPTWLQV